MHAQYEINKFLQDASWHVLNTITTRPVRPPGNANRPTRFVHLGLNGCVGTCTGARVAPCRTRMTCMR